MIKLETLSNNSFVRRRKKLLGRGPSSGNGKTSGRGHKGDGSRSGYKRRYGYEGGAVPLYRRLPVRGFSNARFADRPSVITSDRIEFSFKDGEVVSLDTLKLKNVIKSRVRKVKIILKGDFAKRLIWQDSHVIALSASLKNKVDIAQQEK
ncbi:50S ribosomal protein L15 [Candidatus Clavichlamydia salmonicola]|uniref:Large ribosomal subunit protein uL15 n=1 Tax=Candidatus Clavichlamydia salmonicola TaxID=469812 RepID=A0A1K0K0U5_9CHLA|nr:50S ribosomal protein L15 [Candidatus Clavichlamydia salmonicola]MBF5050763.1 50S ribosomal protein L15 [Candidatus Clavichlamydia salmonicola]SDA08611.1 50S ribosomal protein L15 [Candidatus Clavichlamydia salmonicola]